MIDRLTVLPGALKAWRNERGVSQETLARRVGCTSAMIALVETERRQPGRDLLDRIATELDVPADALAFIPHAVDMPEAS